MTYSCGHSATVLLTDKRDPENRWAVCDEDKKDSDFAEGFEKEEL